MKIVTLVVPAGFGLALGLMLGPGAYAAEITVLSSNGVKTVLEELGPQFEKASGHKLVLRFAAAAELKAQIEKGATFDVALLPA